MSDELADYLDRLLGSEAWASTGAEAAEHIRANILVGDPALLARVAELEAERDEADSTIVAWGAKYFEVCEQRDAARSEGYDRGYDRAVANLRDEEKWTAWWIKQPDAIVTAHVAEYLEAVRESAP